jgi:hypothetical protein
MTCRLMAIKSRQKPVEGITSCRVNEPVPKVVPDTPPTFAHACLRAVSYGWQATQRLPTHLSDRRTMCDGSSDSHALLAARAEAALAAKAVTAHYLTLPTYEPRLASPHRRSYGRHDQPLGVSSFCGAVVRSAYVPGAEATKTNWRRAPVYVWRAFTVIRRRFVASA